jgi:peptidoglycan/LPS O-acetylase OafA/YrhL
MTNERELLLVPADGGGRHNNFNTLRLAMAILVLWSHCWALWYGAESFEPLSIILNGTYNAGNIGVLAFFTISGFLITLSWQRSSGFRLYLAKRVARIVPGYFVAMLLCSLVVAPLLSERAFGRFSGAETLGIASNLLLRGYTVPTPGFDGALNGSLWSIPFEFWCYIGVMVVGLLGLLRWRLLVSGGAALVLVGRVLLDDVGKRPGGGGWIGLVFGFPYFWFLVLPPFLLGMTALLYRKHLPRSGMLAIALTALTIASAWVPLPGGWAGAPTRLLLPPAMAYLIFYIAFHPRWRLGDAARYGDFSYGTYLYAFPIQQLLKPGFAALGLASFTLYVVASTMLSLIAGVASWFLVERWFELRKMRRAPRPLEQEALLVAP